jgi:hypothetical protein
MTSDEVEKLKTLKKKCLKGTKKKYHSLDSDISGHLLIVENNEGQCYTVNILPIGVYTIERTRIGHVIETV